MSIENFKPTKVLDMYVLKYLLPSILVLFYFFVFNRMYKLRLLYAITLRIGNYCRKKWIAG